MVHPQTGPYRRRKDSLWLRQVSPRYVVSVHKVTIYTDHANLVYLYDPYGRNPGIARHTASKLMRLALKLSAFLYVIDHLPGESNVWADILTRWEVSSKRRSSPRGL